MGSSSVAGRAENSFMNIHSWLNRPETAQDKPKQIQLAVETLEDRLAPALFQAPIVTGTGGLNPVAVATTDFNGDGKFDVAVVNNRANNATLSVLLGNGNGTFS